MKTPMASLSIAARVTLDMHSLNNEGGEGNQIQTRMVDIVDHLGELHNVNAISGDMLKHVLMEHFYQQAREQHLALCKGCERFNVNRINFDEAFLRSASKKDYVFIDETLQACAMDDVAGFLVTEGRSTPRKSVSEFGWVLGIPGKVRTDSYFHVKYASERGEEKRSQDAEDQKSGANRGQNIFHRPASSGIYAIVCHLELARIGYNDIIQDYAIDDIERQHRATVLLESLLYTFIELNGAMRSTQLPHLVDITGVLATSTSAIPAPLISPLIGGSEDHHTYRQQVKEIASALNGNTGERVRVQNFDTISDFATQMRALIDSSSPFMLATGH
jgi:CRISPR-associated protein Cst2